MSRNNQAKLQEAVSAAMEGKTPSPMVYLPPEINGKRTGAAVVVKQDLSVKNNIAKIVQEADPIGFLIAVQRGHAFEGHAVKPDGTIVTFYEEPSLKMRVAVAKYLADRVMPRLSVVRHIVPDGGEGGDGKPNASDWAQIVEAAASHESSGEGS